MKNLFICIFFTAGLIVSGQENKSLRWGLHIGLQGNDVNYAGGMEEASARFNSEGGGGALGFDLRYDFNRHWMLSSGLGLQSFGFNFTLAENYSLLSPSDRNRGVQHEFTGLESPLMIHYKFNPNCRQVRWLAGIGLVSGFIGGQTNTQSYSEPTEGNTNMNTITSQVTVNNGFYGALRFSVGREKMFRSGRILNVSMLFNAGLGNLATARVNYKAEGKDYEHHFNSNGSFIGFRLSYFFKPALVQEVTE